MNREFAHIVRESRENAGLTQQEVAEKTGIDPSRLSRIETGKLEPTREEVTAILKAVGTGENDGLAEIVWDDLKHFSAPTWNALSKSDRSALLQADKALGKLKRAFHKSLRGHVDKLKQALDDCVAYLINLHHRVCLIGHIGVGKSTVANTSFNLMEGFAKRRRRRSKGSPENGLLPTGGGGTTAFAFQLSYGPEPSIRIVAQRDDAILRDVRELCDFWIAEPQEGTDKRERMVPLEMERLYRNMTGLARRGGKDPVSDLVNRDTDADDLMDELITRLKLSERTRVELLYREDREKGQSEADWLRQRCEALNLGKLPDCPLPRQLDIALPNPALTADGFRFSLVDLRGIPTNDLRPDLHSDLVAAYDDPRALLVLCSSFLDAPDHCVQTVVGHITSRSANNESPLDCGRVTLLVLARDQQPESVRNDDGSPAQNRHEGYELKRQQAVGTLGEKTADKLAIRFFDARRDPPEPIRDHILSRIEAIREFKRSEINRLEKAIDDLIKHAGEVHFKVTQNKVRDKIENLLTNDAAAIEEVTVPAWMTLIEYLRQSHPSSIWSVTRRGGEGRSIDIYSVFAEIVREDSKIRTRDAVTGLKTLLKDILGDPDMRKKEMARSESFVSEIICIADSQHESFLKQTHQLGFDTLKQVFQNDLAFWLGCADLWGQGGGFRAQVAEKVKEWFKDHAKVIRRLNERVELAWDKSFVAWLRTYTVDAGSGS